MKKPILLGVTVGDVNGIGPEVALKAASRWASNECKVVLLGPEQWLVAQARKLRVRVPVACPLHETRAARPALTVWDPAPLPLSFAPGKVRADASRAACEWIRAAVQAAQSGELDAIVTAPICKEGLQAAGISAPGHTEMLAELTGTRRFAMMLFGGPLRVVLVTRHVPISEVARVLTRQAVFEAIELTAQALPWLGFRAARIGVCGLNPHAGDGGRLGSEEAHIIEPAVRQAQRRGYRAVGPVPGDVIFHEALKGKIDAVVAMYHDQGLAPLKMIAFETGVNVTLGLPIVRTSPDHGTAFDIAGKNRANPTSMLEAIKWAAFLARRRNPWAQTSLRYRMG